MEFYEAITNLNILSSIETDSNKHEKYKECIHAILDNHNELEKAIKDNQITIEKLMLVNEKVNKEKENYLMCLTNVIDKLSSGMKAKELQEYIIKKLEVK